MNKSLQEALKYGAGRGSHSEWANAIAKNLQEKTIPLVYADWVQEQNQEGLAEHIRTAVSRRGAFVHPEFRRVAYGAFSTEEPKIDVQILGNAPKEVSLYSYHPLVQEGKAAVSFGYSYPPDKAHSLLKAMVGVEGSEQAIDRLEKVYPHLKTSEAQGR